MLLRTFGQDLRGNGCKVVRCNPSDTLISHEPVKSPVHDRNGGQQIVHEEVRMDMAPRHTAALDIPLDHFMPGEEWIGRAAGAEDSSMHDKLEHGVARSIDNCLTLMDHLYRMPGCQEEAVDPRQGGRKSS